MGAASFIDCHGLSHFFERPNGERMKVLEDVDLGVEQGTFVSILGPSGCGKTTLLRIFHGLIKPTNGQILIGGVAVDKPTSDRAMVFQEHNLLPWKTARDNLLFACRLAGIPSSARAQRADSALERVGLKEFADHYPNQLSGGMKQRIGIARALALAPRILLMDEPFGALDAQTREIMQDELLQVWEADRRTVVFITHSIDEAILLSDHVIVMSGRPGRVKEIVPINIPRPRHHVRDLPEWGQYRRRLWNFLLPEIDTRH